MVSVWLGDGLYIWNMLPFWKGDYLLYRDVAAAVAAWHASMNPAVLNAFSNCFYLFVGVHVGAKSILDHGDDEDATDHSNRARIERLSSGPVVEFCQVKYFLRCKAAQAPANTNISQS